MLEKKVNAIVNVLRCIAGARWGGSTDGLLLLHTALVRQTIAYSIPVLQGISPTSEKRLNYMIARSLRICLGVPRATSTELVFAEAREPPVVVLRTQEVCRHYFRLATHDGGRPLCQDILRQRIQCQFRKLLITLPICVPNYVHWLPNLQRPPWTIPPLKILTDISEIVSKSSVDSTVAKMLSLDHIQLHYDTTVDIYTDGSTSNRGSTSAFTIPKFNVNKCFRL